MNQRKYNINQYTVKKKDTKRNLPNQRKKKINIYINQPNTHQSPLNPSKKSHAKRKKKFTKKYQSDDVHLHQQFQSHYY